MALTGPNPGAPLICPAPLASCAAGVMKALDALVPERFAPIDGAALLGERAALLGLSRQGAAAPGGACRLLDAQDGTLAVNLARASDWDLVPAWLEHDGLADWPALGAALAQTPVAIALERAHLLGLAVAAEIAPSLRPWVKFEQNRNTPAPRTYPIVIDLSALWAGPLAAQLLLQAGGRVIKVESPTRPDGARAGDAAFFNLMNAGKESAALDVTSVRGREQLLHILQYADIVIESSRPRALRQLGIDGEALVRARAGLTWISITGYGRAEPEGQWIAYGDDASIAAGLSFIMREAHGMSCFCGDAIADPLTGLHAALAALAGYRRGGGFFALALRDIVSHCALFEDPDDAWRARALDWRDHIGAAPLISRARPVAGTAAELGAHTGTILREFSC